MELTSSQNPKIKQLLHLKERKERDKTGLFLIEGFRELQRAVRGGVKLDALFISPSLFLGENEPELIRSTGLRPYELPDHLFRKISYRDRPDGLLAVAHQMQLKLEELQPRNKTPFFVLAEAIEKPGNLGTILRSADAAGSDGVVVVDRCTDIYNPNVVRASVGTLFTVPTLEASGEEALLWLKKQGVQLVAATPSASLPFTEADLTGPVAIAVGTEQLGLSQKLLEASEVRVRIPMRGVADSLNVATATTLLLYEVLRQRESHL